jgi:hypothetical protein
MPHPFFFSSYYIKWQNVETHHKNAAVVALSAAAVAEESKPEVNASAAGPAVVVAAVNFNNDIIYNGKS